MSIQRRAVDEKPRKNLLRDPLVCDVSRCAAAVANVVNATGRHTIVIADDPLRRRGVFEQPMRRIIDKQSDTCRYMTTIAVRLLQVAQTGTTGKLLQAAPSNASNDARSKER